MLLATYSRLIYKRPRINMSAVGITVSLYQLQVYNVMLGIPLVPELYVGVGGMVSGCAPLEWV